VTALVVLNFLVAANHFAAVMQGSGALLNTIAGAINVGSGTLGLAALWRDRGRSREAQSAAARVIRHSRRIASRSSSVDSRPASSSKRPAGAGICRALRALRGRSFSKAASDPSTDVLALHGDAHDGHHHDHHGAGRHDRHVLRRLVADDLRDGGHACAASLTQRAHAEATRTHRPRRARRGGAPATLASVGAGCLDRRGGSTHGVAPRRPPGASAPMQQRMRRGPRLPLFRT